LRSVGVVVRAASEDDAVLRIAGTIQSVARDVFGDALVLEMSCEVGLR
jgi:hypothetical protein